MAGHAVELTVVRELAPLILAPFAHLADCDAEPALRIDVTTLDEPLDDLPDSGVVLSHDGLIEHRHRDSIAILDRERGTIRASIRNDGAIASWHRAKPLQVPLSIFFADRGIDLVHGGLVSLHGRGALIAGNSGAGKSTLATACAAAGLDFLGDDCVAVRGTDGYSIFGSSSLIDGDTKSVIFPERTAVSTSIRAIVLPRITHEAHVTLRPASAKEALLALAPGSILRRAVPAAEALGRMTRMAREIRAFRLEMGPIDEAAARVRELLEA